MFTKHFDRQSKAENANNAKDEKEHVTIKRTNLCQVHTIAHEYVLIHKYGTLHNKKQYRKFLGASTPKTVTQEFHF